MKTYRVVWEIDIDADSPHQAAQKALEIQRGTQSDATVFDVTEYEGGGIPVHVDLQFETEEN